MNQTLHYSLTLFHAGDKVKATSLLHLLRGKRTSSVLMFGNLHQILPFFGLIPYLTSDLLEDILKKLAQEGHLAESKGQYWQITSKGKEFLAGHPVPITYLDGVQLAVVSPEFFRMLFFITQVLSELSYKNAGYIPLESNTYRQNVVKKWLARKKLNGPDFFESFYREWHDLLDDLPHELNSPDDVVNLLTGHGQIGQTYQQVKGDNGNQGIGLYLEQQNTYHYLLNEIKSNPSTFPLMTEIILLVSEFAGNHSAQVSYQLFQSSESPQVIMAHRKLKKSTVVDHLIEGLILDDKRQDFSFINKESFVFLSNYLIDNSEYKLWKYAEIININPEIEFLDFRSFQIMLLRNEGAPWKKKS